MMTDEPIHAEQMATSEPTTFLQRWLPHPLLSLVLVLLWLALLNQFSIGGLFVAIVLGVLIPVYTSNFWPDRPTIRSPIKAILFMLILAWDILIANLLVAWIILFRPASKMRSQWIAVPLDLHSAEAITVLAATITLTPGTVTSDLSSDGRTLLIHCLDVADPEGEVARIKQRYERRIKAIFP
jgi:multicomponent K+:H+ antiporter subunit E